MINESPLSELSVTAISSKLHISRRLLELHYQKAFRRGIHADITRLRLQTIRRQLTSTHAPIPEIVTQCGFRTLNAAQVAYRRMFGEPMSEIRRKD